MSSTTVEAAKVVGLCAAGGAALGLVGAAVNVGVSNTSLPSAGQPVAPNFAQAALGGAVFGSALGALGGLVVAIFSSDNRDEALQVAGLGLGATIIGRLL